MLAVNSVLNRINEWSEPNRKPFTRVICSRLGTAACVPVEVAAIGILALQVICRVGVSGLNTAKKIFNVVFLKKPAIQKNGSGDDSKKAAENLKKLLTIAKLIIGIVSTILIGIIFSPKMNFRFHMDLGLAVDNLKEQKEREMAIKLDLENKKSEVERARARRFEEFQSEMESEKQAREQEQAIDTRLAEFLVPQVAQLAIK